MAVFSERLPRSLDLKGAEAAALRKFVLKERMLRYRKLSEKDKAELGKTRDRSGRACMRLSYREHDGTPVYALVVEDPLLKLELGFLVVVSPPCDQYFPENALPDSLPAPLSPLCRGSPCLGAHRARPLWPWRRR